MASQKATRPKDTMTPNNLKSIAQQILDQSLTRVIRPVSLKILTRLSDSVEKLVRLYLSPDTTLTFSQFGPMWDGMSRQMYAARDAVTTHLSQMSRFNRTEEHR